MIRRGENMYYYDWTYIFVLVGLALCSLASINVSSTFKRYDSVRNARGLTGEMVAQMILRSAGIYDVTIQRVPGDLTDHYSPKEKVLRLSDSVYGSTSVGAIGVAAHECGHAIQHQVGYMPLSLRMAVISVANIGSKLSYPLILAGLFFGYAGLINMGAALFTLVVILQFITLPVEFNASGRALAILKNDGILEGKELAGARSVLTAAALTYVAALVSSVLQLARLLLLSRRRR